MPAREAIDLDAQYAERFAKKAKGIVYVPVTLFGRDWRVSTETNVFAALAGGDGDAKAILRMTRNVVHPEERDEFASTLMSQEGMDAEIMLDLLNSLTEVAAERPTKSPAASSAGRTAASTKRRTSAAR